VEHPIAEELDTNLARRAVVRIGIRIPGNLAVFVAAIFLSNSVNVFTTIYARPGKPVPSPGLWWSCISSLVAAGLWTALAAKKESIDKATQSGAVDLAQRERVRAQMWNDIWARASLYLGGAIVFSILAMMALVFLS
jgi:hypothetical protein